MLRGPFMKTIILYRSKHHGNTKKLVDAIVEAYPDVETVDVNNLGKNGTVDLKPYTMIGLASGIYYGKFDKDITRIAANELRQGDKVFALMTYGGRDKWHGRDIDNICRMKQAMFVSAYGCCGYDSWGPFKLRGGIQKGHPTDEEIQGAVDFYKRLVDEYGEIFEEQYQEREQRLAYEAAHPRGGVVAMVKRTIKKIFDFLPGN